MTYSLPLDRAELQVARAWNLYRAGRSDDAIAAMPDPGMCSGAGSSVAVNAANLLVLLDEVPRALEVAYIAVCLYPNDVSVLNRYVAIGLRAKTLVPHLFSTRSAQPGTVVVLENATGRRTIELTSSESEPTHWRGVQADRFVGLDVGSTIVFEEQSWRVTAIESKHSRLVSELLASLHTRFPGEAAVRPIPVDEKGAPQVKDVMGELAARQAKATAAYQQQQCSIHELAEMISEDVIDTWYLLIRRQFGAQVHVATGSVTKTVGVDPSPLVLDALSCVALHETELLPAVKAHFGRVAVTQSTLDALVRARDERRFAVFAGMGVLVPRGDDVAVERTGTEQIAAASKMFRELVEWLRRNARVLGVPLQDANGREALGQVYSESAADSMLVAKSEGWILVAEDARVTAVARERFDVEAVSSIGIVRVLRAGDDSDTVRTAVARMSTWGYAIDVDVDILLKALRLDGWKGGAHIDGVLRALAESGGEARARAGIAVDTVKELMIEPVIGGSREQAVIAVLDGTLRRGLWEPFWTEYGEREQQLWRLLPDQGRIVRATLEVWRKARGIS